MAKIDPLKGWYKYTDLMNSFDNPKYKAMLDNMRHHLKYECLQDPIIFETMVENPDYRFYGSFDNAVFKGMTEVKDFYFNLWNSNSSLVELEIYRCLPGEWGVACDGAWHQQVPGEALVSQGKELRNPEATYLSHAHLAWFFPFTEINGKMLLGGEICYIDEVGSSIEEIDDSDVLTLDEARDSWMEISLV